MSIPHRQVTNILRLRHEYTLLVLPTRSRYIILTVWCGKACSSFLTYYSLVDQRHVVLASKYYSNKTGGWLDGMENRYSGATTTSAYKEKSHGWMFHSQKSQLNVTTTMVSTHFKLVLLLIIWYLKIPWLSS
jgi:hypothetical protein